MVHRGDAAEELILRGYLQDDNEGGGRLGTATLFVEAYSL